MADADPEAVFTSMIRESPVTDRRVVEVPNDVDVEAGSSYTIAVYPAEATVDENQDRGDRERSSSGSRQTPPVRVGDLVDVTIESLGEEGDGVAKVAGGFTVFVPDGEVGDELTVEIETVKERFAFAEIRATAGGAR